MVLDFQVPEKNKTKFKNYKNRGIQTEHRDFHYILFQFPQTYMSP